MCNVGLVKLKTPRTWFAVVVAVCLFLANGSSAVEDREDSGSPFKDTFIISAHRAGGRVHAPDNSMPNILYAIQNQLTAVEVDLRLTRDGDLVLWHDASLPKEYVEPGAAGKIAICSLSSDQIRDIRYSAMVRDKLWDDVKVAFADELVRATKGKINLHIHPKDVPAKRIVEFIRRLKIQEECMVMQDDVDYLKEIASAEPDVCLEFTNNTLGRRQIDGAWQRYPTEKQHELYHQLMKELKTARIDAFCTKGLTKEKVAICHEFGIMVRTSAANMQRGCMPDRYLEMGVDYALTDDPLLMKESVTRLRPDVALSRPGQTFLDLIRGKMREAGGEAAGECQRENRPREGLVYFGFADFNQGHVDNTLPLLEKYGIKGTFYTNMGRIKTGSPLWNKMREMAKAGHCFVDHTLEHRASDWGEKPNEAEWLRQTTESLRLFGEAGIEVHGWWQPGGPGAKYTPAIRDFVAKHYRWAWAMQAAYPDRMRALHWHFAGDLYNFVIGCGGGMDYAKDQADAERFLSQFETRVADTVAQGRVALYGGHHTPPGFKQWGLEEACRYVRQAGFRTVTLNQAVHACTHTRESYGEFCEQMPNATLELDRDGNGRPDGWLGCVYSPQINADQGGRCVTITQGAMHTTLYGPEPGKSELSLRTRCATETAARLTVTVQAVLVGDDFVDRSAVDLLSKTLSVTGQWQPTNVELEVADRTDRLSIRLSSGSDAVLVASPSFRRVP